MPRHYLNIPKLLQPFFPGGAPPNWREVAFNDATEGGTTLVIERLPPNDDGVRIAIHGDQFYFEAGRDKYRPDTLFLYKILRASAMLPRSAPIRVACNVALWRNDVSLSNRDSVADLFGVREKCQDAIEAVPVATVSLAASPLLLSMFEQAPEVLIPRFRPVTEDAEPQEISEFVNILNRVWVRHRLDRFSDITPRHASMLRGVLRPANMSREERDQLLAIINFDLLNSAALALRGNPQEFNQLVDDLGGGILLPDVRHRIWIGLLANRSATTVRRELHLAGTAGRLGTAVSGPNAAALAELLRAIAAKDSDSALLQLADGLAANADGSRAVEEWAKTLQFDTLESAVEPAGEAPFPPHEVATQIAAPERVGFTTQAEEAFTEVDSDAFPDDKIVERWLLVRALPDRLEASAQVARIGEFASTLQTGTIESLSTFSVAYDRVHHLRSQAQAWVDSVPSPGDVERDLPAARAAYSRGRSTMGPLVANLINESPNVSPAEVERICDVFERRELLTALPEWLWWAEGDEGSSSSERLDLPAMAVALGDPEVLSRVEMVVNSYDQLAHPQSLSWLQPPQPGTDVDAHIRQWFERSKDFLETAPVEVRNWLASGVASMADFEGARAESAHFVYLRERVSEEVFTAISSEMQGLATVEERRALVGLYRAAVETIGEQFDPKLAPFQMLQGWVVSHKDANRDADSTLSTKADVVAIEHNFVQMPAQRAALTFVEAAQELPYGYVDIPLVLVTERPKSLSLRLEFDIKQAFGEGWRSEWGAGEPDTLEVPIYGWRPQPPRPPDRQKHHHSFRVRIPIRRPRTDEAKFSVLVRSIDTATGRLAGESRRLEWETVRVPDGPQFRWSGTTIVEYVSRHPIGPQANAEQMLAQLDSSSSIAVIAPRRFGKTTLVQYLAREAAARGFLVPSPVLCTLLPPKSGGTDFGSMWKQISDDLASHVGTGLQGIPVEGWPDERAFDEVKRRTGGRFKGILLIFDEAQLLFPRSAGPQYGTVLKGLLEYYWSKVDGSQLPPVLMALIGLPSLTDRMGVDARGHFSRFERSSILESDLQKLIPGMTSGLQTTRDAREQLARTSGNLYILRALLEKLVERARAERRRWVNFDDVLHIENSLKEALQSGQDEDVASYIRDAVNDAERVTDWEPNPCWPTGAAMALCAYQQRVPTDLLSSARDLLNEWCQLGHAEQSIRVTYDAATVERHVRLLRDRGLIRDSEFASGLLQAWLTGTARRNVAEESFRAALFQGAQRRIVVPEGADLIGAGGQAEVRLAQTPRGRLAFRVRAIAGKKDEDYLLESAAVFQALKSGTLRREPGSEYVFDLEEIGLSATNPGHAVLVYHWIEGEDLSTMREKLDVDMVVTLGVKLSRALRLVHRHGILHRDIRPSNIVLQLDETVQDLRPVLIDFGFARRIEMATHSLPPSAEFCAPEVKQKKPHWSPAADVYALGATLECLLKPAALDSEDLRMILSTMQTENAAERPSAEVVLDHFEELLRKRQIDRRRAVAWTRATDSLGQDVHKGWLVATLRKFRLNFEALELGLHHASEQRLRVLGDILNQVLESCPPGGNSLRRMTLRSSGDLGLAVLVAFRNKDAHAGQLRTRDDREALDRFAKLGPGEKRALIEKAVTTVGNEVDVASLRQVLEPFWQ